MRLVSGRLVNVCQHKDIWLKEMSLGITAVTGPNGSGKSNLLNAMGYLNLTGDYSRCPNGKAGLPRRTKSPVKSSYSESVWEHNGQQFLLRRSFLGTGADKTVLEFAGQSYTKAAEIQEQLRLLLGCTQSVFEHVFVPQWGIFKCLVGTEAERTRDFATLCGTDHCETIWEVFGEQLAKDEAAYLGGHPSAPGLVVTIDSLRVAKATALADQRELRALRVKRKELLAAVPSSQQQEKATDVLSRYEQWQQRKSQGPALLKAFRAAVAAQEAAEQLHEELKRKLGLAETEAEQAKEAWNQAKQGRAALDTWEATLAEIETEMAKNTPPVKPERPTVRTLTLAEVREQHAHAQARCLQLDESVTRLQDQYSCPLCRQPVEDPQTLLTEIRAELAEAKKEGQVHARAVKVLEQYELDVTRYEEKHRAYEATAQRLQTRLTEHRRKKPADVKVSRQAVAERKVAYDAKQAEVAAINAKHLEAVEALGTARTTKTQARKEWLAYKAAKKARVSEELYEKSKKLLDACQAQRLELSRVRGQIEVVKPRAEITLQSFKDSQAAYRRQKPQKQWLSALSNARDIVHRNNLPKLVHEHYMRRLVKKTNSILTDIDDPFVLEVVDGVNLQVRKSDGDIETVAGLSGGEKALLAIAYRLAEVSIFAGDLGMLVLDEPTAGLDANRLEKVAGAIRKLSGVLRKRGTQLLLVTHEPRLAECCDAVVSLER